MGLRQSSVFSGLPETPVEVGLAGARVLGAIDEAMRTSRAVRVKS